ncbi:DNA mismatch repair endonuclease MutL [bacterium]|nr:DNA mismatch repair endonuclease MutL [bacterium]
MTIRVLPQTLINQIAAGEVVVNMASVLKEMVENSIDAGATHIDIELANDLRDMTIADDGCGMDRDDAELSLQRHATSKIRTTEDLFAIQTRGFRGEALASIAAVSRLELQTRRHEDLSGTRVVVEGGAIERIEGAGCPAGTRIIVRDLFFNTPARRNFLKTPVGEFNAALRTLVRQALAAHEVGVRVVKDDKVHLDLPVGQSLADRFKALMGSQVEHGLLELAFDRPPARVRGYLARPLSSRSDRRSQYLFVNDRPFSSKQIAAAIEQACRGFIMIGRFPIFCVFIDVPPEEVDINVHPTKEEVRFRNERSIAGACYHAARLALEEHGHVPNMQLGDEQGPQPAEQESRPAQDPAFFTSPEALVARAFERKRAREVQSDWIGLAAQQEDFQPRAPEFAPALGPAERVSAEEPEADAEPTAPPPKHSAQSPIAAGPGERPEPNFWRQGYEPEPLGQIANTYIVVRFGPDLLLVDQHAAHERIRFIELQQRSAEISSQTLLVPETFDVPADRRAAMETLAPALQNLGFEVEEFGGSTWSITGVPSDLQKVDPKSLILDLLDEFESAPRINRVADLREKILIRAACHSAIRAGQRLTAMEMEELLRLMRQHQLSFTCPHGRPTVIRLAKDELDKQFKRIV